MNKTVNELTLPELMGNITQRILQAPLGETPNIKGGIINDCRRDLASWYAAQTPDNKKEFARNVRTTLDGFKMIGEAFAVEAMTLTARDL